MTNLYDEMKKLQMIVEAQILQFSPKNDIEDDTDSQSNFDDTLGFMKIDGSVFAYDKEHFNLHKFGNKLDELIDAGILDSYSFDVGISKIMQRWGMTQEETEKRISEGPVLSDEGVLDFDYSYDEEDDSYDEAIESMKNQWIEFKYDYSL